jgi:hypothetical protein
MSGKKDTFFIVSNPAGSRPPRYRHTEFARAKAEAARLARENPGQEFFVMEARLVARVNDPVVIEEFENFEDGMPF